MSDTAPSTDVDPPAETEDARAAADAAHETETGIPVAIAEDAPIDEPVDEIDRIDQIEDYGTQDGTGDDTGLLSLSAAEPEPGSLDPGAGELEFEAEYEAETENEYEAESDPPDWTTNASATEAGFDTGFGTPAETEPESGPDGWSDGDLDLDPGPDLDGWDTDDAESVDLDVDGDPDVDADAVTEAEARELTAGPAVHGYPPETATGGGGDGSESGSGAGRSARGTAAAGATRQSPWQRSYAAWRRAGVEWQSSEVESRPEAAEWRPEGLEPGAAGEPGREAGADREPEPEREPAPAPAAAPAAPAAPITAAAPAGAVSRSLPRVPRGSRRAGFVVLAVVAAVGAGGGAYAVFGGEEPASPGGAATLGEPVFATDPAATTDGRAQELRDVAAMGTTIVAVGSEVGGDYSRGQFLVSADGGRGWRVASVRTADGAEPPPGESPERVSGGRGGWIALGGSASQRVLWTSKDGRTWIRQPAAASFQDGDQVNEVAVTGSGHVAVGASRPGAGSDAQAVAWLSGDGRTWRRLAADRFKVPGGGKVTRLEHVAARGNTLLAQGTSAKPEGKKGRGKRRAADRPEREGFWRSADGGGTWAPVTVPQAAGSYGSVDGVVAGPGGFFTVREARHTSGKGRRKRSESYAVVMRSADGARWSPAGQIKVSGYTLLDRMAGSEYGLAALVTVQGGRTLVFRGRDGATWRQAGEIERRDRRSLTGAVVTPAATVVTGRQGDGETAGAYLSVVGGSGPVDLGLIPDAVHPERSVTEVAAFGGSAVAVGSANGQAAVWTSKDGSAWERSAAAGDAFAGAGQQRFHDVTRGGPGWLAVGVSGDDARRPLVVSSPDARRWRPAGQQSAFSPPRGGEALPYAAAYGRSGYVIVGERVVKGKPTAMAWHSVDLKGWRPVRGIGGPNTSMRAVAAGRSGYVAVGTKKDGDVRPAAWTSRDGRKWKPVRPPRTTGGFDSVVARGDRVLATGWQSGSGQRGGALLAVSADGGKNWQSRSLPGGGDAALTAATAAPRGFVVAATSGSGGREKLGLWSSADGGTWRPYEPAGAGLAGPGSRRLTGLTPYGAGILAVGFTGDHRRDVPILWKGPVP